MLQMKSCLVIGASRGIGRQIVLSFSASGYKVGVAAKTTESTDKLPGSIHTVVQEIKSSGGTAVPVKCDVRSEKEIKSAIETCIERFGDLDVAIYNAGAITWDTVKDTPLKRYDLMQSVNVRGAYCMVQEILPRFLERKKGKIILVSPPIYNRFFKGKTPYAITKVGMTVLVHGLANELKDTGVSISTLWPATGIKSFVTEKMNLPDKLMRSPEIFADAMMTIANEKSDKYNGQALIDEDLLRSTGVTDFSKYRCDPEHEPERMMPRQFPSLKVDEENYDVFPKL